MCLFPLRQRNKSGVYFLFCPYCMFFNEYICTNGQVHAKHDISKELFSLCNPGLM